MYKRPGFLNFLFSKSTVYGVIVAFLLMLTSYVLMDRVGGWTSIFRIVESGFIGGSIFFSVLTIPLYAFEFRQMSGFQRLSPLLIVLDGIICSIISIYINQFTTHLQTSFDTIPLWLRLFVEVLILIGIIIPVLHTIRAKHYEDL